MSCVCQPNREFTHASTQIYVWRQSIRVGARADGTDLYRKQGFAGVMRCCNEVGAGMLAEAVATYRLGPERPGPSARGAWRDESTAATFLTGIVLEFCGKPFATWPPSSGSCAASSTTPDGLRCELVASAVGDDHVTAGLEVLQVARNLGAENPGESSVGL